MMSCVDGCVGLAVAECVRGPYSALDPAWKRLEVDQSLVFDLVAVSFVAFPRRCLFGLFVCVGETEETSRRGEGENEGIGKS